MQKAEMMQTWEVYSLLTLGEKKPFLDVELLAVQNDDNNHL